MSNFTVGESLDPPLLAVSGQYRTIWFFLCTLPFIPWAMIPRVLPQIWRDFLQQVRLMDHSRPDHIIHKRYVLFIKLQTDMTYNFQGQVFISSRANVALTLWYCWDVLHTDGWSHSDVRIVTNDNAFCIYPVSVLIVIMSSNSTQPTSR